MISDTITVTVNTITLKFFSWVKNVITSLVNGSANVTAIFCLVVITATTSTFNLQTLTGLYNLQPQIWPDFILQLKTKFGTKTFCGR